MTVDMKMTKGDGEAALAIAVSVLVTGSLFWLGWEVYLQKVALLAAFIDFTALASGALFCFALVAGYILSGYWSRFKRDERGLFLEPDLFTSIHDRLMRLGLISGLMLAVCGWLWIGMTIGRQL